MVPNRVVVMRTDKLGDFMLIWPALALLRQALPKANIAVLVSEHAEAIALACPFVDEVLLDRGQSLTELAAEIRRRRFDTAIALFSTMRIAFALWRAGIPYRLAPATKISQLLFNHRLVQRRSRSAKPEHAYNADLIKCFLEDHQVKVPETPAGPYLSFPPSALNPVRDDLQAAYDIPERATRVIVHPGSGGSASNLAPADFAGLINRLVSSHPLFVLVTAGPGEKAQAELVRDQVDRYPAAVHVSSDGLLEFSKVLATGDVFVSGSTGPLHIAGALDVPTAAFYPRRRSSTALRWQTTNKPSHRLAFSPPESAGESEMTAIDIDGAASAISHSFLGGSLV